MSRTTPIVPTAPWRYVDSCPCLDNENYRRLADAPPGEEEEDDAINLFQIIYTCIVLFGMLIALLSDRMGADSVMLTALTLFMAANIITIDEGVAGFANEGLLTVIVLFVVAQGISVTGALDWYMGKLLGRPSTVAGAQLRLMIPIAIISAFLNNTPVVAVMIPIVLRWGKNIGVSPQQLLVPLSFSSILGGTCTLIGTSTNLVVVGLLEDRYPDDPSLSIGLFDLGEFGVPVAMIGLTYILIASPWLLPGGRRRKGGADILLQDAEHLLLGARLMQWSPAAGRSVKRSGLRDTGGIFLVSVHRATTGNVHRAVGQDFVLNVGDILYFTGLVESFGEFCEEHGLEVVTNETTELLMLQEEELAAGKESVAAAVEEDIPTTITGGPKRDDDEDEDDNSANDGMAINSSSNQNLAASAAALPTVTEGKELVQGKEIPVEIGLTVASLMESDETERMRTINQLTDQIRNIPRVQDTDVMASPGSGTVSSISSTGTAGSMLLSSLQPATRKQPRQTSTGIRAANDPAQIVVTTDSHDSHRLVIVGINARDRAGLLLDISKGLLRLNLQLRHTEASVVGERSLSIWRCEVMQSDLPDLEEVWSVLNALLELEGGIEAVKKRGLRVIRASVTQYSALIGKTASEVDFRQTYKAAIVAVQKASGKNSSSTLSTIQFDAGDVLILQASDSSPLLKEPPLGFHDRLGSSSNPPSRNSSGLNLVKLVSRFSASDLKDAMDPLHVFHNESEPRKSATTTKRGNKSSEDDDAEFYIPGEDAENVSYTRGSGSRAEQMLDDLEASEAMSETNGSMTLNTQQLEVAWRDLLVLSTTDNATSTTEMGAHQREFLTAMEIAPDSALAKKTIAQAGLTKLPGVFLVSIERPTANATEHEKKTRNPVFSMATASDHNASVMGSLDESSLREIVEQTFITLTPEEPLAVGDILWFSGSASAVGDLRKIPGLRSFDNDQVEKINERVYDRRLVQAVIARKGPLVGKTVREVRFRTKYGAAVIAVHREGHRVHDHPGQIKLQAGDVLLLEAGPTFIERNTENDRSFALLAEVEDSAPPRLEKLIPALVLTVAMLAVYTAGVASLLVCALAASILMVAIGIMSEQEARDAVNWEVYVTIACAFGIGSALVNSGVAGALADFLVAIGEGIGIGDAGLYGAVYFATFLISSIVTNNAAAALLFPIAMDAAEQTGADILLMSYTLMLGASASFMSPFGYQTNLMIYGPGGYTFKDFLYIGIPMQIVLWLFSVAIVSSTLLEWWANWLICLAILVGVASFRLTNGKIGQMMADRMKNKLPFPEEETTENK